MKCNACEKFERRNVWACPQCQADMKGGIVFITGISGSGVGDCIRRVIGEAAADGHSVALHDIGQIMRKFAEEDDPNVQWDWILNADEKALRHLRALAFQQVAHEITSNPDALHIIDLHLSFRWRAYLMKGFEPHVLKNFEKHVRCFVNIIEDLPIIQENLRKTTWGDREILELLIWRDEELLLTDLFANSCGRVNCYAIAAKEPPSVIERIIWHPELKKIYLSFPITNLKEDKEGQEEIKIFRDEIRKFLVVFDPFASKDYDETYKNPEMTKLRKQVGEATEDRDYRFIDQADAIIVYYPKKVPSKGVDAEMNHARKTGKPIFLYCPEDPGGGPFAVHPSHFRSNSRDFVELLRGKLSP